MHYLKKIPKIRKYIKFIITVILLFVVWRSVHVNELKKVVTNSNFALIILSHLMIVFTTVCNSWRLKYLIEGNINEKITLKQVLVATYIGYYYNLFMPTSVGGDIVKGYVIAKDNKTRVYKSIFQDRFIGLAGLSLVGLVALTIINLKGWHPPKPIKSEFLYILFTVVIISSIFLVKHVNQSIRYISSLFKKNNIDDTLSISTINIVFLILISTTIQIVNIGSTYVIAQAVSAKISFTEISLVIPLTGMASNIPISFAGFGIREISAIYIYGWFNISNEIILAITTVMSFNLIVTALTGWLIQISRIGREFIPGKKLIFSK